MNYQGFCRASGCPVRRQEIEYDIGETKRYETEPAGYMPGMRMEDPPGYSTGMRRKEPVGYAPGMQAGQPEYGMEMQPEYGVCPYMVQPRVTNGVQPGNRDMGRPWMQPYGTMPFYQMPGYPQTLWQEMESERDMQKLKEMYPDAAKEILPYVEEECDKMEYDGSVMFDEYPDRVMMGKIRNHIYDRVKDRFELPEDGDRDEMFAMNQETRRRYPPRKNWLGDLVDVLLFQEMHRRRCRHRNCRGWR